MSKSEIFSSKFGGKFFGDPPPYRGGSFSVTYGPILLDIQQTVTHHTACIVSTNLFFSTAVVRAKWRIGMLGCDASDLFLCLDERICSLKCEQLCNYRFYTYNDPKFFHQSLVEKFCLKGCWNGEGGGVKQNVAFYLFIYKIGTTTKKKSAIYSIMTQTFRVTI